MRNLIVLFVARAAYVKVGVARYPAMDLILVTMSTETYSISADMYGKDEGLLETHFAHTRVYRRVDGVQARLALFSYVFQCVLAAEAEYHSGGTA